jgi:enterochelin esterase-like enzyme
MVGRLTDPYIPAAVIEPAHPLMTRFSRAARAALGAFVCSVALVATVRGQLAHAGGQLLADTLRAAALVANKYGDSPDRTMLVYLPPSYATSSSTRYPVIYLLHGFGSTERSWAGGYRGFNIRSAMDSLVGARLVREMIVVMPNGRNRLGGSFYTNSESSGNWDDYIARELIAYVDGKYRTLASPDSRGLAGHSMGGYGALALGMRHAGDIYGAVYALSACCTHFSRELTYDTEEIWRRLVTVGSFAEAQGLPFYPQVFLALSAAFSPNPNRPPLYVDFPFERKDDRWRPVEDVQLQWSQHSPYDMLPRYASRLRRLRGLAFDVGTHDDLVAPSDLAAVDSALDRAGVVHHFETYDGDHTNRIGERMTSKVLPFFSRVLEFADVPR